MNADKYSINITYDKKPKFSFNFSLQNFEYGVVDIIKLFIFLF